MTASPGIEPFELDDTARASRAALAASEERFRTLVQNSTDVVLVVRPEGTVAYASPALERVLGRRPEDLIGTSGLEMIHPDDLDDVVGQLARLNTPGAQLDLLFRSRHTNGAWRWLEASTINLCHDPNIGGLVCNFRDVTDRLSAEEALRSSEARFRALVEHSGSIIEIINPEGKITWVSSSLPRVFGWPADKLVGTFAGGLCHPDDADDATNAFMECLAEDGKTTSVIFKIQHIDGDWRSVECIFTNRLSDPAVRGVVSNIIDISQRKALERRLAHQATHDLLTGLPNRTLLLDRLRTAMARAQRHGQDIAVLFLDLDNFKVVNDSLGHAIGDKLLTAVASRLDAALRPGDSVARFGGDEFVVLCEELDDRQDAIGIADRILEAINRPITVGDNELFVGVSIGIAFPSGPNADPDELLRNADAAMYEAKKRGRDRWVSFDNAMRADVVDRLDLESALRRALDADEFRISYQPLVEVRTQEIRGVEALIRWEHPERGLLLPAEFMQLAEDTGLIVPIGRWVLEQACRQIQMWIESGPTPHRFRLAVNLSARQLSHATLVADVAAIIADTGIDPGCLSLEITESALMDDVTMSAEALGQLKDLGVDIAVDDFGTGYSSLTHLRAFTVDVLKIDQSFVRGLGIDSDDSAIVEAVVNLAHTLGLRSVAEGVETAQQLDELRRIGCEFAQGFLLGRPAHADGISRLLIAADRVP